MYKLNDNTFVGTSTERTTNNFKIGSYFIDSSNGYQYVKLFDGNWLQLVTESSIPDPLTVDDLVVNNTLTAGTISGDGASVTNVSATNITGVLDGNTVTIQLKYVEGTSLPSSGVNGEILAWFDGSSTWRLAVWFDSISNWKVVTLS